MNDGPRHLVALEQCGLELQAPHLRNDDEARIETSDVDAATLPDDSLRFVCWAPTRSRRASRPRPVGHVRARGDVPLRAERPARPGDDVARPGVQSPTELVPGTATSVRVALPPATYADGTLDVAVERVTGPDVVLSELRLFSSRPPAPAITVVGDSRGGLIGTVGAPDGSGMAGVPVRVTGDAGTIDVATDAERAVPRPASRGPAARTPRERHDRDRRWAGDRRGCRGHAPRLPRPAGAAAAVRARGSRRGLELSRRAVRRPRGPAAGSTTTRVPGHVIYDGLVPEDGVATFQRTVELPATWAGRAVFLRCDGAYGRAEVVVNGTLAGVHGSGATSFDVDLTRSSDPAPTTSRSR